MFQNTPNICDSVLAEFNQNSALLEGDSSSSGSDDMPSEDNLDGAELAK